MNRVTLPPEAAAIVTRIEALLAEADPLLAKSSHVDETTFALAETRRRYLPDTVATYLDIPPSQRDAASLEMLIGQLNILERATAQRLAALSDVRRMDQAANGTFLAEKFGPLETLPEAPQQLAGSEAPPQTLVARLFEQLGQAASHDPRALVEAAAERFTAVLPAITQVKRGLLGGAARSVVVEVPVGDHVLRYALSAERAGVETSCTKLVRGIALRTQRVPVDEWLRGLFEDVGAYVERDRTSRELLGTFLGRQR